MIPEPPEAAGKSLNLGRPSPLNPNIERILHIDVHKLFKFKVTMSIVNRKNVNA
jgi:hypothetical protein